MASLKGRNGETTLHMSSSPSLEGPFLAGKFSSWWQLLHDTEIVIIQDFVFFFMIYKPFIWEGRCLEVLLLSGQVTWPIKSFYMAHKRAENWSRSFFLPTRAIFKDMYTYANAVMNLINNPTYSKIGTFLRINMYSRTQRFGLIKKTCWSL